MTPEEINKAIDILEEHPECIAWSDFGDAGNSYTGRIDVLTSKEEIENNAHAMAETKICMPKMSSRHLKLSKEVAKNLNIKYVTYDWLLKAVTR